MRHQQRIVRRRIATASMLGVLACAAGPASANPTAPVIQTTVYSPLSQTTPTIQWTDAIFDFDAQRDRYYLLTIADLDAGTQRQVNVPVPASLTGAVSAESPPLSPYHHYRFSVHANELDSSPCGFFPSPSCQYGPGPESAQTPDALYDPYGPNITLFAAQISAAAVNVPLAQVQLRADDPGGLSGIEFARASSFSCSTLDAAGSCFIPNPIPGSAEMTGTFEFPLTAGPDGRRTVMARFRDAARPVLNPCSFCFGGFDLPGNVSAARTVTVLLDTRKPTISLVQGSSSALTGVPVAFDASGSKDGTDSAIDSGIDRDRAGFPSAYAWAFGDGGKGYATSVSHTYTVPGTYQGTLALTDRAGNVQTQAFSVTVAKPVPTSTGTAPGATGSSATPGAGSGTTSPVGASSGGATPVGGLKVGRLVRFGKYRAHRLGRVRVSASAVTTFVGALRQGKRTIQRIGVTGGPGTVTLGFIPPKAGRYVLSVRTAGITRTLPIAVTK